MVESRRLHGEGNEQLEENLLLFFILYYFTEEITSEIILEAK